MSTVWLFMGFRSCYPPYPSIATEKKMNKNARMATARLRAVPQALELVVVCFMRSNELKRTVEEVGVGV